MIEIMIMLAFTQQKSRSSADIPQHPQPEIQEQSKQQQIGFHTCTLDCYVKKYSLGQFPHWKTYLPILRNIPQDFSFFTLCALISSVPLE
jgi:hypothetical protein